MKNIERDFTLIAQVPDDVKLEDCEVIIHKASASYPDASKGIGTSEARYDDETGEGDVEIVVLSTRFVSPDTGEELESD